MMGPHTELALNGETLSSYLEAAGTVAAVIVALFIQVYLVWRRRPDLSLSISEDRDSEDNVVVRLEGHDPPIIEFWVRAKVAVRNGRDAADGVKVIVAKAERPAWDPIKKVIPSGHPLAWSSIGGAAQTILPGTWLRVDVLRYRIQCPQYPRQVEMAVTPGSHGFDNKDLQRVLGADGQYSITVLLGGRNCKTSTWKISFHHLADTAAETDEEIMNQIRNIRVSRVR